jgi:hypothetical protein
MTEPNEELNSLERHKYCIFLLRIAGIIASNNITTDLNINAKIIVVHIVNRFNSRNFKYENDCSRLEWVK